MCLISNQKVPWQVEKMADRRAFGDSELSLLVSGRWLLSARSLLPRRPSVRRRKRPRCRETQKKHTLEGHLAVTFEKDIMRRYVKNH